MAEINEGKQPKTHPKKHCYMDTTLRNQLTKTKHLFNTIQFPNPKKKKHYS